MPNRDTYKDPSGLPGNPSAADALDAYDVTSDAAAIVASSLAIAFEQRTANLIDYAVNLNHYGSTSLHQEIAHRLALDPSTGEPR